MPAMCLSDSHSLQDAHPHVNEPFPQMHTIPDVIVLSSDDESTSLNGMDWSSGSKRKLSNELIPMHREVLEISSSSDEGSTIPKAPGKISKSSAWHQEILGLKWVGVFN
jgi:hypothetical protein